jgi:hypothetical protein
MERSLLVASLSVVLVASVERGALAQTISIGTVTRVASDDSTVYACPGRGPSATGCIVEGSYQGVGFKDCSDATHLVFSLAIAGLPAPNANFQVWAGTGDCTAPGATNSVATATCWALVAPVTPQAVMNVDVRVADLVGYIGAPLPPQAYQSITTSSACSKPAAAAETTVNVFFMFFPNGQNAPLTNAPAYPVKVKLKGPGACTNVTASPSSDSFLVSWQPPAGNPTLAGFDLFATAVGSSGDAGAQIVCADDAQGAIDVSNVAQTVIGSATEGTVTGLSNATSYAVGVAAVDDFGNVGTVTGATCAASTDHVVVGCLCTLGSVSKTGDSTAVTLMAVACAFVRRRRARAHGGAVLR